MKVFGRTRLGGAPVVLELLFQASQSMTVLSVQEAGSVTRQLPALKLGDADIQEWFVTRLLPQVLEAARRRLSKNQSVIDEEDIAIEVLRSFLGQAHRFRQLENRADLNQVISMLVRRKAIDAYRRFRTRHAGCTSSPGFANSASMQLNRAPQATSQASEVGSWGLNQSAAHEMAIDLLDALETLLKLVPGDEVQVRQILRLRLEGYSPREISQQVQRGERAVYRILHRIEQVLRDHL